MRGVGDESCSVPCKPTGSSVSTPGFIPDSRSHPISHTRTDRSTHRFNANVAYGLTPSHSIAICTDRLLKARFPKKGLEPTFYMTCSGYFRREEVATFDDCIQLTL